MKKQTNTVFFPSKGVLFHFFIVAIEFVIAFTGVALLIKYYNHKA